jgi:undecaprenyl diphosphate synthase
MTVAAQVSQPQIAALPKHIAVIMDGNGRWANERNISRARGHSEGAEALRRLLTACDNRPFIQYLTLYAFSTENWNRSPDEVADLMNLLRHYVKREASALHKNGVRMRFIGDRSKLAPDIQSDLDEVEALTAQNARLTVTIALSYGGRQEITQAVQAIARKVADGLLAPDAIDESTIANHLGTHNMPDPDLLIRTGGEERLSNFLLWQSAYTELYFCDLLWPDFAAEHLDKAIESFGQRERRFGKRNAS